MASRPTRASIYDLPEEILVSIVSLLAVDPPSIVHASQVPSALLWQTLEYPDLKNLSLVCRDWRRISFPILFRYVKVDLGRRRSPLDNSVLGNVAYVSRASGFDIAFAKVTTSVLLYNSLSPPFMLRNLVQRLLRLISPSRLLIVTDPSFWGTLMLAQVNMHDAWAFEIPYQSVECRQHKTRPRTCSIDKHEAYSAQELPTWNLLEFQEWDETRVHSGNCLTNFGTCMCKFHFQVLLTFPCAGRPWIWQVLSA